MDKTELPKIKIPRVDNEDTWYTVDCFSTKTFSNEKKVVIYLKSQVIAGYKIPANNSVCCEYGSTDIHIDNLLNKVSVKGNLLNDLLRYCKLEEVRNNKFYGK